MIAEAEFAKNLGLAIALGAVVGLERQWRGHDAGVRTNALVAAGAAIFMMVSRMFSDDGRVAAQVVTGIGFLGAGNIMRAGDHVKGLTTAATLWVVAGAGMVAGAGHPTLALLAAAGLLAVNLLLGPLERRLARFHSSGAESTKPDDSRATLPGGR